MDQARVVEVWVPAAGRVGSGRVGSGYLLADRLVLTSYHVVRDLARGARIEVRPLQVPQRTPWLAATLCWPHDAVDLDAVPEQDAALLVIDDPPGGVGPMVGMVRFGQITGQDRVSCTGLGFPDAEARPDNRRDTMPVRGHLDALQARRSAMLTMHVNEGIVPRRQAHGSGWAGSSGTALFCGPLLVGILATDRALADDASVLGVVPLTALAGLPGFRTTLTGHGIDLQLEHASPAARQLAAYLAAARRAATEHPYAGVLPGTAPPLAAVYLRQQVSRLDDEAASATTVVAAPADDVLADPPTCVILSGPGGGKSSLLRTRLADGVERWQDGRDKNLLPVLVPAAALTGHALTEALAAAVTTDLGLVEKLPAAFFETPPRPGARWLVLIDGLDEVADPILRGKALGKVALATSGEHGHLYRFVIATRPLPGSALDTLGKGVPRYYLQPFGHDDLEAVTRGWFRAAPLPDPAGTARRFVQALDRSHLTEIARVPLMTAMLCQLHADAPDQPLPASRGQIYRRFITLLLKHQPPADAPATRYPGLERYPEAHAQADVTLKQLPDLIAYLAAKRQTGNTLPATVIVLDKAQRPKDVLAEDWCTFLETSLRRSGLLTTQADDLVFFHQTLLEHLAARHLMDDPHTGKQALRDVFHHPRRYWPSSPEVSRTLRRQHPLMYRPRSPDVGITLRVWGCRYWAPPDAEPSYVGFLLDAAHHSGLTTGARYLSRLTRGGLPACEFIVTLHRLGTVLPNDVLRRIASRLYGLARGTRFYSYNRVRAAQLLGELGDARAAGILHALAGDTTLYSNDRVRAAEALGELGDSRAADLLDALARHNGLGFDRMSAIGVLARLRDLRAATLLRALAHDTTLDSKVRLWAAEALAELGDARAATLLRALARDTTLDSNDRVGAAEALAGLTPSRRMTSRHGGRPSSPRLSRTRQGEPHAATLLHALARDTTLDNYVRARAAEALAELGDARGADILHALTRDTTYRNNDVRVRAADVLTRLRDPRAANLLRALVLDTTLYSDDRLWVAEALARLRDPRATTLLRALADDTRSPNDERVRAAQLLGELSDARGADILHALARDTRRPNQVRVRAAEALARLGDARGADILHALARDTTLYNDDRVRAAEALARLRDPRAADLLASRIERSLKIFRRGHRTTS